MDSPPRVHELKVWRGCGFDALLSGSKRFELRKNDRSFELGDLLILQEWDPVKGEATGRVASASVSYVLRETPWTTEQVLAPGYVILGLGKVGLTYDEA